VQLVGEPQRQQQLAGAHAESPPRLPLDVRELDEDLAGELRLARHRARAGVGDLALDLGLVEDAGVLELDLGVEEQVVGELVAEVEDGAQQVEAAARGGTALPPSSSRSSASSSISP